MISNTITKNIEEIKNQQTEMNNKLLKLKTLYKEQIAE